MTSVGYDTFARPTLSTRPDGNKTAIAYAYCSGVYGGTATCPTYGAYLVQATPENSGGTQNGPQTIAYYDTLGRVIAQDHQGFDASWIRVATQYDALGRVYKTSRPYFLSGGTAEWTTYTYDTLGRVTQTSFPDGSLTTAVYDALVTAVTNNLSQVTTTTRNAQGLVASVLDTTSHTTSYVYDAFGDMISATDPAGNVTTATYDLRGRKTGMTDPDMGGFASQSWSYGYDVLSELTSQTDAKGQSTSLTYDLLGRPMRRVEADMTSLWLYDSATNGVGRPAHACAASTCSSASYERTPSYNAVGQTTAETFKIDGTSYGYGVGYNSDGRVSTITYPSGFEAQYDYTSLGYLADIKDHSSGAAIWTANAADAELHLTQATAGNGVITDNAFDADTGRILNICATSHTGTCDGNVANLSYSWDTIGNLTQRSDTVEGTTENFCYDSLNRLLQSNFGTVCSGSGRSYLAYGVSGTVSRKSDLCTTAGCMTYGSGAGPHALTAITGTVDGIVNPTFSYDDNGNMTAGLGRTISWTAANMASQITQGSTTLAWMYGPEHERYKQCAGGCTSPTTTTLYLYGPTSSEKVTTGSSVVWNDYIVAGGAIVAERFNNAGTVTMKYFVGDHLGSTAALTDSTGAVAERDFYDSWGKRRNADGSPDTTCSLTSQTTRGFTGQEHDDALCIENFNARMYDQSLGRFLSADFVIPNPMNGQDFSRYSYLENNPLNATDPSGHAGDGETVTVTGSRVSCDAGCASAEFELGEFALDIDTGGVQVSSADETVVVTAQRLHHGVSNVPVSSVTGSNCDPDQVDMLNDLFKLGGGMQGAAELGLLTSAMFAAVPGGQPLAAGLASASVVVGGLGIAVQGAAGWELYQQTGDSTPFRNSLIGAAQSAIDLKEPVGALANGVTGDILGHHAAYCSAG